MGPRVPFVFNPFGAIIPNKVVKTINFHAKLYIHCCSSQLTCQAKHVPRVYTALAHTLYVAPWTVTSHIYDCYAKDTMCVLPTSPVMHNTPHVLSHLTCHAKHIGCTITPYPQCIIHYIHVTPHLPRTTHCMYVTSRLSRITHCKYVTSHLSVVFLILCSVLELCFSSSFPR